MALYESTNVTTKRNIARAIRIKSYKNSNNNNKWMESHKKTTIHMAMRMANSIYRNKLKPNNNH